MASTTETFLKSRVSKPTLNKWSSGFTAVKDYAEKNNLPLIGVWSNGDACGYCVNFEKSLMTTEFLDWQKTSGCIFWFGCSSDKTTDDKTQGTGSKWCKNSKLTTYPFVRVYWKKGNVDSNASGSTWSGGTAKGGQKLVDKFKSLLKDYKPECADCNETTTPTAGNCDNCGEGDCDALKAQIAELQTQNTYLEGKIEVLESRINAVIDTLQAPVEVAAKKSRSTKKMKTK